MVTGRHAFERKSQLSVMTAILEKDPDPIGATPAVPPMLERVIHGCLAKDPSERLQSMHDGRMDLRCMPETAGDSAIEREGEFKKSEFKKSWIAWGAVAVIAVLALTAF